MESRFDRLPPGPLTYEDYVELPDDGRRYEILDGELDVSPAPIPRHQVALQNLHLIIGRYVKERKLGVVFISPIDLILAPTTVVQPDLLFIPAGREAIITRRAIEAPPELVVEVLSTWTARKDRTTKAKLYARYGVGSYWIVDAAARTLEIFERIDGEFRLAATHGDDAVVTSPLFPGLEIRLADVWPDELIPA
jgi:Uma2 family endonuclease